MQPHLPDPNPDPQAQAALDNRRRAERFDHRERLKLTLETSQLQGTTENISGIGVLFFTEGSLRVTVELGDGQVRQGRLVRVQRMSLENTGFAVEFDPE